jgi:hypothetical protein
MLVPTAPPPTLRVTVVITNSPAIKLINGSTFRILAPNEAGNYQM